MGACNQQNAIALHTSLKRVLVTIRVLIADSYCICISCNVMRQKTFLGCPTRQSGGLKPMRSNFGDWATLFEAPSLNNLHVMNVKPPSSSAAQQVPRVGIHTRPSA